MNTRDFLKRVALSLAVLCVLFFIAVIFRKTGIELYRDFFHSSTFQHTLLPVCRSVIGPVEKFLQFEPDPTEKAERVYADLPVPNALQRPAPPSDKYRLFHLCIDAGAWGHVEQFGPLPHFEKLKNEGAWTTHPSTMLPISSCAWNAIDTGYLSGQTGVLGFYNASLEWPPEWSLISRRDFPTKTLAQRIDHRGEIAFTVNLMNSYPAQVRNSAVIGGWWTSPEETFAAPASLTEELRKRDFSPTKRNIPRLRFAFLLFALWLFLTISLGLLAWKQKWLWPVIVSEVLLILVALFSVAYWQSNRELRSAPLRLQFSLADEFAPHSQIVLRFFEQPGWRYGAVHLHGVDSMIHHRYRQEEILKGHYQAIDRMLGQLFKSADEQTLIAVSSDHGSAYFPKVFDLPAWLWMKGYLTENPLETRAVAENEAAANVGCIRLKDPSLAEQVRQELLSLIDPLTGKPVVERVLLREEAFSGGEIDRMPDLLIDADEDYEIIAYGRSHWKKKFRFYQSKPHENPLYSAPTPYGPPLKIYQDWYVGGHHAREGMIALWGEAIEPLGKVDEIGIEDIAPTLMVLLDVPVPEDCPGKPQLEWLTEEFLNKHPVLTVNDPVESAPPPMEVHVDKAILEALEALNYLN
jgi:predicted AlkP superfamily phosphohydrolase/phosphomutase